MYHVNDKSSASCKRTSQFISTLAFHLNEHGVGLSPQTRSCAQCIIWFQSKMSP